MSRPSLRVMGAVVAIGCLLLVSRSAHGRVFSRWRGTGGNTTDKLIAAGGTLAYEAPMRFNGSRGQLSVFGFAAPMAEIGTLLATRLGAPALAPQRGQSLAFAQVGEAPQPATVLLLRAQSLDRCLAIVFSPQASPAPGAPTAPAGTPWPPAAQVRFSVQDEKTGVSFVTGESPLPAPAVRAALRADLEGQGWQQAMPTDGGPDAYVRNARLCLVFAEPDPVSAITRVSVLMQ